MGFLKRKVKDSKKDKESKEVVSEEEVKPESKVLGEFPVDLADTTELAIDEKNMPGCCATFKSGLMSGTDWENLVLLVQRGAETKIVVSGPESLIAPPAPKED